MGKGGLTVFCSAIILKVFGTLSLYSCLLFPLNYELSICVADYWPPKSTMWCNAGAGHRQRIAWQQDHWLAEWCNRL